MTTETTPARPRRRRRSSPTMTTDMASIQGAIALVAARQARRITLSGLRYGERLLPRMTAAAALHGVAVALDRGSQGTSAIVVSALDG